MLGQKNFGKKILTDKNVQSKKKFGKFWSKSKSIFGQRNMFKNILVKKKFVQKNFGQKKFW